MRRRDSSWQPTLRWILRSKSSNVCEPLSQLPLPRLPLRSCSTCRLLPEPVAPIQDLQARLFSRTTHRG
jgi:hypothetical protein